MGSYGQRNAQEGNLKSLQENTPESLQENNQEAFQEANQQASQPMDDSPSLQGEYLLPEVGLRYLSQEELQELSPQQQRYARYEIYALHGRRFKSQELQDYFGSKSWYLGSIDGEAFDESVFNEYEKANLEAIQRREAQASLKYELDLPGYDIYGAGTLALE